MMPRSKTSSAWCVSCVGVLTGTGARGRECKRADPHPLNLELDPHSWPPRFRSSKQIGTRKLFLRVTLCVCVTLLRTRFLLE